MKNRQRNRPKFGLAKIIPLDQRIITLREQKIILDADLAEVYGVTTKALNQAVKRNAERFPADFSFLLTASEKAELVTACDQLVRLKLSPVLPRAFTKHGTIIMNPRSSSSTAGASNSRNRLPRQRGWRSLPYKT